MSYGLTPLFRSSTLQKGLEAMLPELDVLEQDHVFHTIGKYMSHTQLPISDEAQFYNNLDRMIQNEPIQPDPTYVDKGRELYHALQRRMKSYNLNINTHPDYLRRKRRRELSMIKRILKE